jgi:putative ABC transport system permease protein
MGKNIQLAFRSILGNKAVNGINILGLAIGMMAVLLIFQYIRFERGYDRFFENSDRLQRLVFYRYYQTGLDRSVGNNYYIGQIAAANIPEIENFCRVKKETMFVQVDQQIFKEERTLFADSSFLDLFSYEVISGDKAEFLRKPDAVIISESIARKYFGDSNPVGKIIFAVNPGKKPLTVEGVIADVPVNTHLGFDIVVSLSSVTNSSYCYSCNNTNTYFLLKEKSDPEKISEEITALAKENFAAREVAIDFPIEFHLQPVTDIHLHSDYRFEFEPNGNFKNVMLLLGIALLILISAGFNYINLYLSVTEKRISGIGIRIVNGATPKDIILEFISEALLTGIISLSLALLILFLFFPFMRNLLNLSFTLNSLFSIRSMLLPSAFLLALSLLTGLLLGLKIYNVTPLSFIKGEIRLSGRKQYRRFLLAGQFLISIVLIGFTIGALKQISFMQKEAFTMNMDQTLVVKRPNAKEYNIVQKSFQEALLKYPGISEITFSTIAPGEKNSWVKGGITLKGKENLGYQIFQMDVAPDFFNFFNVRLLAGRNFFSDETNWQGGTKHLILNKEAAIVLGEDNFENVIGKTIWDSDLKEEMGEVVGIIDGYFQNSLDLEVKPTIFNCDQAGNIIFIRIKNGNIKEVSDRVASEFRKFFKDQHYEYYFLDEFFNAQYKSHIQLFRSFIMFSLMAMVITCLSLFGLIMAATVSRTKEIGIRKINGASVWEILIMINRDFIFLFTVAFAISIPVIWYGLHKWLQGFAYKTELSFWIFLLAGFLSCAIALITVSWQSWKAATRNPVRSLRYE